MKYSVIFRTLSILFLSVSLILSVAMLTMVSDLEETQRDLQGQQQRLVMRLDDITERLEQVPDSVPVAKEEAPTLYRICTSGDGIGVYTEDGLLVKRIATPVSMLPAADRHELDAGLIAGSWEEVLSILQDYDMA